MQDWRSAELDKILEDIMQLFMRVLNITARLEQQLSAFDDLNTAVSSLTDAVNAAAARDQAVAAGVAQLQQDITALQGQIAANQPPDLTGVTATVNSLASTVGGLDTEDTSAPQAAAPAAPAAPAEPAPAPTDASGQPTPDVPQGVDPTASA